MNVMLIDTEPALVAIGSLLILVAAIWLLSGSYLSRHFERALEEERDDDWSWLYAEEYERYDGDYTGYEDRRLCDGSCGDDTPHPLHTEPSP